MTTTGAAPGHTLATTAALAAAIALGAAACRAADAGNTNLVLGEECNGKTVAVDVRGQVIIRLAGNPTTGYQWKLERIDGTAVTQSGEMSYESGKAANSKLVGVGGTFSLPLNAVEAGKASVLVHYLRPWEKGNPPAKTFAVTIEVRDTSPAESAAERPPASSAGAQPGTTFSQGITGLVMKLTGNHMPGPGARPGAQQAISVPIHVFKGKVKPFDAPDARHSQLVTIDHCQRDGIYKVGLRPGEYTVVAEIAGKLYLNSFDGDGNWSTVTVKKDEWTDWRIVDSSEAVF